MIHPVLTKIHKAVTGTEYEQDLFLVGGAVRDQILGKEASDDFDLVTTQSAPQLAYLLFDKGLSSHFPVIYETFGTAMIDIDGMKIELVTARKESYNQDSRKPSVERATLREDSERRDFTCNTLLMSLESGEVLDPLGQGLSDLNGKLLRTPLDPEQTFDDDPLRMMRAVRFKWKLGFALDPAIEEAILSRRDRLGIVSIERIREELTKMLTGPNPGGALGDLMRLQLFREFAPEFSFMVGCEQGKYHHLDVWNHTLKVVDNVAADPNFGQDVPTLLAALFHDVGKPATRSIDTDGNIRFFTHEHVGASLSKKILTRWRLSNDVVSGVSNLVKNHMRLGSSPTFSPSAARRLIRDMESDLDRLLALVTADSNGLKAGVKVMDLSQIKATIEEVQNQTPAHQLESPLSGTEIISITGLKPGPEIGKIKDELTELVLEGKLDPNDKYSATQQVKLRIHQDDN